MSTSKPLDAPLPDGEDVLRQQAEQIANTKLVLSLEGIASLTPEDIQQVFYELQVHQIELEMQNEALRQAQVELELSHERYFDLYDLAPIGYLTLSPKGIIQEANLTASTLFNVPREALVQHPITDFILPADQDIYYLHTRKLYEQHLSQTYELHLQRADHPPFWGNITATQSRDQDQYRLVISDITPRKQAEAAAQASHAQLEEALHKLEKTQGLLIKQERLAAMGQLAAGIAHDFNNILAVLMLYVELSLQMNDVAQIYERLQVVLQQIQRAASLVEQILDFGRRAILDLKPLDLMPFLQDRIAVMRQRLPRNITLHLTVAEEPCLVLADSTRIQQLLINLILNARDAMPDGGQLFVEVTRPSKQNSPLLPDMPEGNWVCITVRDTGEGMPDKVLQHVFEPFFTTKAPGKGSGLGLAQVYGIVKQHKGFIDVASQLNKGTTFAIYLPETGDKMTPALPPVSQPEGQGETVLIVDDNLYLIEAMADILTMMAYKTHQANNGVEALAFLQAHPDSVDVILSDLVMPEMNGHDLWHAMQEMGLKTPMIIISGHPLESAAVQEMLAEGVSGYLSKPPDMQELRLLLREAVEGVSVSSI